jgi:hypothetical protein
MFHSRLFAESQEYREKMFEKHVHDRPLVVQVKKKNFLFSNLKLEVHLLNVPTYLPHDA